MTNPVSGGINSAIKTIKKRPCDYRSQNDFTNAIYFHCGGLSLYPTVPTAAFQKGIPRRQGLQEHAFPMPALRKATIAMATEKKVA